MGNSSLSAHNSSHIRVLLIEDNPGYARLIEEMFKEAEGVEFALTRAGRLSEGLSSLDEKGADIILLDLSLPDSAWPDTLLNVLAKAPDVPVVVLTGFDNPEMAVQSVQSGAQDYLIKGQIDANLLVRTIRYAIERQRMKRELQALSLTDELTGIYNRRGFLTLADQQLKTAGRMKVGLLLLFIDMDDMKWINDTFGHHEGDRALSDATRVLRDTFRESDIISRMGGDEFAVIAMEDSVESGEVILSRLQKNIDAFNARKTRPYELSLSIGLARYRPEEPCGIDALLERADKKMYEQKHLRKRARV
ncbi:MAG TPA: diguanylate cyclase [Dissulfurispiraceae bacterium]